MSDQYEPDIPAENDLHELAMALRRDLTRAQGKLTELMRQIGTANLENRPTRIYNLPGTYVPGQLRYLNSALRLTWNSHPNEDDREAHARIWLAGFTDSQAEIDEHIAALAASGEPAQDAA